MLFPRDVVIRILNQYNIKVTGVLHIGAHECEELGFYEELGLTPNDVTWLDAIPQKVDEAKARGIPNVYQALVTDKDDELIKFNISNNVQSSSIFDLGTHATAHPEVVYTGSLVSPSVTIDTFCQRHKIDIPKHNFWNIDIQGAEFKALVGGEKCLAFAKALYLEVNEQELYKGCTLKPMLDYYLESQGFICVAQTMCGNTGWGDAIYVRK
jgi:FkbM family methyltransferase